MNSRLRFWLICGLVLIPLAWLCTFIDHNTFEQEVIAQAKYWFVGGWYLWLGGGK